MTHTLASIVKSCFAIAHIYVVEVGVRVRKRQARRLRRRADRLDARAYAAAVALFDLHGVERDGW